MRNPISFRLGTRDGSGAKQFITSWMLVSLRCRFDILLINKWYLSVVSTKGDRIRTSALLIFSRRQMASKVGAKNLQKNFPETLEE